MNEIKFTSNFHKVANAYNSGFKLIVQQGGQGSSKTFSTLQLLYIIACNSKKRIITVCSFALPHLKGGAMRDFDKIIETNPLNAKIQINKSNCTYQINNSIVEFFGIEGNEAKAHGLRRDILYINEANKRISYKVFDQLFSRTHEATIIDFNPSCEFWYHEKIKDNFEHKFIQSNFLDNEYLPESEIQNILSKKNKIGFENWWKVYGLGELGQLEDSIFSNWKYGEFDNNLPFGYGLDFGVKDPDALVKVAIDRTRKQIYLHEEIYKTGNKTTDLYKLIESKVLKNKLIVADSAGLRQINDLKHFGFNISAVNKKSYTVVESIRLMQDYEIIISPESQNLAKEFQNYLWLDRKGEIPQDADNHLIDASRYYIMTVIKPHQLFKGHKTL
jgi:phage terminase large subunit